MPGLRTDEIAPERNLYSNAKYVAITLWLAGCVAMTLVFLRQGMIFRKWLKHGRQMLAETPAPRPCKTTRIDENPYFFQ